MLRRLPQVLTRRAPATMIQTRSVSTSEGTLVGTVTDVLQTGAAHSMAHLAEPMDAAVATLAPFAGDVPMWVILLGSSFVFQPVVFPLSCLSAAMAAKYERIYPYLEAARNRLPKHPSIRDRLQLRQERRAIYKRERYSPLLRYAALIQFPYVISWFIYVRHNIATYPELFENGGPSWLTDLTQADPTFVLPVLTGFLFYISSLRTVYMLPPDHKMSYLPLLSLALIPLWIDLPAGVLLLLLSSATYSNVVRYVLALPRVRKRLGYLNPHVTKYYARKPPLMQVKFKDL